MNKKKHLLYILLVLLIFSTLFIYQTHKSVDQELSEDAIKIKEILNNEKNTNIISKTKENISINISKNNLTTDTPSNKEITNLKIIKSGEFNPNAIDSDSLHRAWGNISIIEFDGKNQLVFSENFKVTNAPDLMIYLVKSKGIETKEEFNQVKEESINLGQMTQFSGYQTYELDSDLDLNTIKGVVIWCEKFGVYMSTADFNK